MIDDAIKAAVEAGFPRDSMHVLPMNSDKQWALKQRTDKDDDAGNDLAYKAACAFYATVLNLETITGHDLSPEDLFFKCVSVGAIKKQNAYIVSYEKVAQAAGFPGLKFRTQSIEDSADIEKMCELLRSKTPLVIFIGKPNDLDHVEACHGYIDTDDETLFFVRDPGWQSDTHIAGDLRMFHFSGSDRKYSFWKGGKHRKAYKFGWYEQ